MAKLLNVAEAAELIGVPKSWLYARSARGDFPAGVLIKVGHYVRFDADGLLEWLRRGGALENRRKV